jgi:hypothetical protein
MIPPFQDVNFKVGRISEFVNTTYRKSLARGAGDMVKGEKVPKAGRA